MNTFKKKITAVLMAILIAISSICATPATSYAIGSVPIDTMFNWHNIQQQSKEFVLNGLAWNVAKMALQQLTTSIVNWINTGFEGSPAFVTDPEGYFMDLGDQITGSFIENTGILQELCSPWNIDLRLSLALGQTRTASDRYRCTLGSIIDNAKNATVNGYSIEGFTSGDFSQGGWPAFIAMTSEPQNNPYGSYLQAKSDLESQIFGKQTSVNNDLNRGQGFLSWQKCDPVVIDATKTGGSELGLDQRDLVQLNNTGSVTARNGSAYKAVRDEKTEITTYKKCSVQTPGSVISSGLNKSLGSGIDQLNLADSINEITSALFAQLITQVMTKGLGGSTQRTSGQTQSYIDQLYSQSTGTGAYTNSTQNIQSSYAVYLSSAHEMKDTYAQAVSTFQSTRNKFSQAQGCFQDITVSSIGTSRATEAQHNIDIIGQFVNSQVAPAELTYTTKFDRATSVVDTIESRVRSAQNISSGTEVQTAANELQDFMATQIPILQQGREDANTDLTTAQAQTAQFDIVAQQYMTSCQALKASAKTF